MSAPAPSAAIAPAARAHRWRSVVTIAVSRTIDDTESGLMNNLFPVIRASLGLSLAQLGVLTAIPRFARMLFGPLWSMAADRWGRKRVLVFATGIWGAWTGFVGLAQSYEQLLLLYAIGAIGTVAGEPIANGLIADHFRNEERGKAYGLLRSLTSFGSLALTPLMAQFSRTPEGWRHGLYLMGVLSVLSGIAIALFVREPAPAGGAASAPRPKFGPRDIGSLLRIPTFRLMAGSVLFVTSIVMMPFMVTFFVEVRGWTTADANFLQGAFTAGWMISSLLGGFLGDWFERRFGPRGRIALMQIYLVAFSAASYLVFQVDWGKGPLAFAALLSFGLIGSIGFSGVAFPMVSHVVPGFARATAFAMLFSLLQGMFAGVLSLASGRVAELIGLKGLMFWVITVPYAINALYWSFFYRTYAVDRAKLEEQPALAG